MGEKLIRLVPQIILTAAAFILVWAFFLTGVKESPAQISPPRPDVCQTSPKTYTPVNVSTATTTRLVTGTSGTQTYICNLFLYTVGANNVAIVEGTGATCGSGTAGMLGGATAAAGQNLGANQGFVEGMGGFAVAATATAGDSVCIITSAAVQLSGVIVTVQQ